MVGRNLFGLLLQSEQPEASTLRVDRFFWPDDYAEAPPTHSLDVPTRGQAVNGNPHITVHAKSCLRRQNGLHTLLLLLTRHGVLAPLLPSDLGLHDTAPVGHR